MWKEEFCDLFAHFTSIYQCAAILTRGGAPFRVSKLLWRFHGASLEGRLKKSLCGTYTPLDSYRYCLLACGQSQQSEN